MKCRFTLLKPLVLVMIPLFAIATGCGGSSSTRGVTGDSATVTVTGTVEVPSAAGADLSVGGEKLVLSKAIADVPVSGGTVTAQRLDGTKLGDGTIGADGKISGLAVDPAKLDDTKQVLVDCETTGKKRLTTLCDLTSAAGGTTIDCGKTNADSTLAVQQVFFQADPDATPDNPTALSDKISAGTVNPLALFKTYKGVFDVSSAAGTDDAAGASQAIRLAFKAAYTSGIPPTLAEINQALQGGAILDTWKAFDPSLAAINMGSAVGQIQNYLPAVAKIFADATTYQKFAQIGDTGWQSCSQFFSKQSKDQLANGASKPEIFQGYLIQNANDYISGNTGGFEAMKKAGVAQAMGELVGKCGITDMSGKFDALAKLVNSSGTAFDSLASDKISSVGEAFCNQLKAANTTTEIDLLKSNPSTFAGKIFDAPQAYTGTEGVARFNDQYATFVQNPTVLIGTTSNGCAKDADCAAGYSCNVGAGFCVNNTCTTNCSIGAPCTSNGMCASGACTACQFGVCASSGFCTWAATVNPLAGTPLKPTGAACTGDAECAAGNCNSGYCGLWMPPEGTSAFVGFFKRNPSATCIFSINIDAWSGTTVVTFGSDDPNNPQANTLYGGNVTLTGSNSPFSITNASVTTPATSATDPPKQGTLTCPSLTLANGTFTGTCTLGGSLSGSCTINHTRH